MNGLDRVIWGILQNQGQDQLWDHRGGIRQVARMRITSQAVYAQADGRTERYMGPGLFCGVVS